MPGWSLRAERVRRGGIAATLAHVDLDESHQPHRRLPDVLSIIHASTLPQEDRTRANDVFCLLADAEARVHGTRPEEIEFHEVGSLDAIVDVVGAVVGLRLLGVERLYCSALPAGGGTARSMHGDLPVPAPAMLELMAMSGAPWPPAPADRPMEMVTPTGRGDRRHVRVVRAAADARGARRLRRRRPRSRGLAERAAPLARRGDRARRARRCCSIETNIDDMNPEIYGYVQELLFAAGAADVWFQPIQMKKNRPGVLLAALCSAEHEDAVTGVLLRETSTLGVRVLDRRAARGAARDVRVRIEPGTGRSEGEAPAGRAAARRAGVRSVSAHRGSARHAAGRGVPGGGARGAGAAGTPRDPRLRLPIDSAPGCDG